MSLQILKSWENNFQEKLGKNGYVKYSQALHSWIYIKCMPNFWVCKVFFFFVFSNYGSKHGWTMVYINIFHIYRERDIHTYIERERDGSCSFGEGGNLFLSKSNLIIEYPNWRSTLVMIYNVKNFSKLKIIYFGDLQSCI